MFSNFFYVDQNFQSDAVLRRIFSLARKLEFQSLLVEEISENDCPLLTAENAAYALRRPEFTHALVWRLSFWSCPPNSPNPEAAFLGYAIVKRDFLKGETVGRQHVYEAVIRRSRTSAQNNFVHCERDFTVHTSVGTCTTRGALYAQQNNSTFVCAHVALRTVLSCASGQDLSYAEINKLAGIDHVSRKVGGGQGMSAKEIEAVLTSRGVSYGKIVHIPGKLEYPGEFQRDLYGFIESGGPVLLGFQADPGDPNSNHMIPVVGHTFNEDAWVPEAQRGYFPQSGPHYSSEAWLSTYVVHDDNFGPYFCLPRHYLKKELFRMLVGVDRFKAEARAIETEVVAFDYLRHIAQSSPTTSCPWYKRLMAYVLSGLVVLRTLMVKRDEYVLHIRNLACRDGIQLEDTLIASLEQQLPPYFWMVEVAAPELFAATRRKFGEILLSATAPIPKDYSSVFAARLPGTVLVQSGGLFQAEPTAAIGHSQLISIS